MNETDEGSSNGDDHSSDIIIKIPRVETSDDEVIQPPPCHVSSSEESDGEDIENDTVVAGDHPLAPLHLFKKAKRKARELSKKGELELATKERIRAVAYCRLVYGNGHWQLAKAHAKLGEAYLKGKVSLNRPCFMAKREEMNYLKEKQKNFEVVGYRTVRTF